MEGPKKASLAIIEDSDDDYALFARVFAHYDEVWRWPDGESTLEAFREGRPEVGQLDAVIVDLNLPGMNGISLIEQTRALPGGSRPVICVLSTSGRPSDMRRAEEAGADGYLVKPTNIAGLRALPTKVEQIASART